MILEACIRVAFASHPAVKDDVVIRFTLKFVEEDVGGVGDVGSLLISINRREKAFEAGAAGIHG